MASMLRWLPRVVFLSLAFTAPARRTRWRSQSCSPPGSAHPRRCGLRRRFLSGPLGEAYRAYCARTRRWL